MNNMSFLCHSCGFENNKRDNVYGTICINCNKYVPPENKSQLVKECENRFKRNQLIILQYLKKKILGEKNGNKIKKED